jgi:glycosyltransferase involved in cell wall biosynthesis
MAFLTVTIPTKNRPRLLERAVRSVLDHTDDVRVIVVDDGSDEDNAAGIAEIAASDPRIARHRNDSSRGAPSGRNQGLELADGPYWATLDDDDLWLPGKWDAQRSLLEAHGFAEDLVVVSAIRPSTVEADASRHAPKITDPEKHENLGPLLDRLPVRAFLNSYVVPTELMRSIGGYDPRFIWGEHTDLLIRLMSVARFVGTAHVGVLVDRWHEDAGSRTGSDVALKVQGVTLLLDKHREVFAREPQLLRRYRHVLGVTKLRNGDRWGGMTTLAKAAVAR